MINYTCREVDEMQERRDEYQREGALVAMCLCALSGAIVGMIVGWWIWA